MKSVDIARHALRIVLVFSMAPLMADWPAEHGETVERDLGADRFSAGGTVMVTRSVPGDLVAAGGAVEVSGDIGGDLVAAGGYLRLASAVGQGVYAAGGRVHLTAPVQRNARIAGGKVEIARNASIAGNLTVAGGEVRIEGAIGGYLQAAGGRILIDGPVGSDVEAGGGNIALGPNARIAGKLRYASREELQRDPAAQVLGGVERFSPPGMRTFPPDAAKRFMRAAGWMWTAGLLVIALIVSASLPAFCERVRDTVRRRWPFSLLLGFVALVCIPVAALIALVTIVGIPLGLVAFALYPVLLVVGYVLAGMSIGQLSVQRLPAVDVSRAGWRIAAAVAGVLLVSLLGRLPGVGPLVVLAVLLLGIGAVLLQLRPRAASG